MAHLGDDVAAFVDGQLSSEATAAAQEHLACCDRCQQAVRQQQSLKARMGGSAAPQLPSDLLASLGSLPATSPKVHSTLPGVIGAALVLIGASMVVMAAAYSVAPRIREADPVTPPFDRFVAMESTFGQPHERLTAAAMNELDASGWPSKEHLGIGFFRVDGQLHSGREVVAQAYIGQGETLLLFEQVGTLDDDAVKSFHQRVVADRPVWVRPGHPRVVTWDADGMVYTLVSDLKDSRLGELLADLPAPPPEPTPWERVGAGLSRMSAWLG
jgi:hypothetical protein